MTNKEKRALFIEGVMAGVCGYQAEAEALRRYPKTTKTVPNEVIGRHGCRYAIHDGRLMYQYPDSSAWGMYAAGDCTPEVMRQLLASPTMEVEVDE